ncbi:unnamed protein product [Paramecium sonneborni]|uniref:Iron-binding zinc finger CDGSH type domain-containing protein n=1 Tax=Paramecium sonneborni TaxID=65129 RepID=A0A8S1JYZ4_9CILI|nr:unnamed protein product [Paramecium sonneborni]CAD8047479.1 unnamed protein product [Paramecium sonneborni]
MIRIFMRRWFSSQLKDLEEAGKVIKLNKENKKAQVEEFTPIPTSPVLGPIKIEEPKVSNKTYRWCSCGLSQKQPLCDGSHKGTSFKPYRFTLEQNIDFLELCGCKLTKNVPFCDGETCVNLRKQSGQP